MRLVSCGPFGAGRAGILLERGIVDLERAMTLFPGDRVRCEVEGVGAVENIVRAEKLPA